MDPNGLSCCHHEPTLYTVKCTVECTIECTVECTVDSCRTKITPALCTAGEPQQPSSTLDDSIGSIDLNHLAWRNRFAKQFWAHLCPVFWICIYFLWCLNRDLNISNCLDMRESFLMKSKDPTLEKQFVLKIQIVSTFFSKYWPGTKHIFTRVAPDTDLAGYLAK